MTTPKLKTSATFLALMLGSVLAIHQVGCLTPEQKADLARYEQQLDRDQGVVVSVQQELAKYTADMKALMADVEAGKVPLASGLAMAKKLAANMDSARARLSEALAAVDNTRADVKRMQASGTPWWAYAIPTGLTLAQILGTFVPQLGFLVPVAGALKSQLAGTQSQLAGAQTQLADTEQQLAVRNEIAGSLSRTVDGMTTLGAPAAALKEQLLLREQQADEVATKADYDELRRLAKCGQY